jgi:hypothetical protein
MLVLHDLTDARIRLGSHLVGDNELIKYLLLERVILLLVQQLLGFRAMQFNSEVLIFVGIVFQII